MCGIVGFLGRGNSLVVKEMMESVRHRGPDAFGAYEEPSEGVYLGHQRLSVLDIVGGKQPMSDASGSVWVTYNGEIYNHAELRTELIALGYRFQTDHSDTEVLVYGYLAWGGDLPRRLNGMFAFAIWDREHRRLFIARDRFGEKPLYYTKVADAFVFASEIQALLRHPGVTPRISVRALQKYFAHGFFPGEQTLYENVRQLPGGSSMTVELDGLRAKTQTYWRFEIQPENKFSERNENDLADELRHLLGQAVKRRLISDVPLGILLSGGIDSSTVLAMAAQYLPADKIKAFTVGFDEPTFDETPFAKRVAEFFKAKHYIKMLSLSDAKDLVRVLLPRMGEPLADPSLLPTYLLSKFTREHVTVALSGDGGDELFAGYDPFKALGPALYYHRCMPKSLHRGARLMVDLLPISNANMSFDFKLRRALQGLSYPPEIWCSAWMAPLEPKDIADLLGTKVHLDDLYSEVLELAERTKRKHPIDQALEYFTNFYLQNDILTKVDRASMLVALETRAVMLDNDLVAFCERLPHHLKFRNGRGKYLLRKALSRDLDSAVLDRPKKGFGIPLAQWLREIDRPALSILDGGFNQALLDRAWAEHRSRHHDHRLFLWSVVNLAATLSARRLRSFDRVETEKRAAPVI